MKLISTWSLIGLLTSTIVFVGLRSSANVLEYEPDWKKGTSINIRVPYTVGTHEVVVQDMKGRAKWDSQVSSLTGHFTIPLTAIDTGSSKRDCHMREGLGLDYKKTKYPDEHVCSSDNLLDETQISFPNIEFDLESLNPTLNLEKLTGEPQDFRVLGKWTFHGVTKQMTFPATLAVLTGELKGIVFDTTIPFHLSDYGVVIKKAFVISVKDEISAHLHIVFFPLKTGQ